MISLDLETFLIGHPKGAPKPVCVQWCDKPPLHALDGQLANYDRDLIKELLAAPLIGGHNIAYDARCIMADDPDMIELVFGAYAEDRVICTLLNQKLIDIANGELERRKKYDGYDMGAVAGRHGIEVDKSDPWRMKYGSLYGIPWQQWPRDAQEYAIRDGTAGYELMVKQEIVSQAWEAEYGSPILHQGPARARADLALSLASIYGVRTNARRCEQLEKVTLAEIARMREILVAERLVRKNGSKDTKAAKARVREAFGRKGQDVPLVQRKDGTEGDVSTERDAMILSGDEILVVYAEYTTANNLLGRVEDLKRGVRLPLQPRYDSLLETGRTSSSKGDNGVQIQNFPRRASKETQEAMKQLGLTGVGARECLEPREGNVYVLADYSSAELHTLAQVHIDILGRSSLADILNNGHDVHLWVGTESYSEGLVEYTKELKKLKDEEPYSDWRQGAKPIVFGRPGGMGAAKIVITGRKSYGVIMTEAKAKHVIQVYERIVPEIPELFDIIGDCLGGRQRGLMRQLRTGRWRGGATFCGMANSYFQGLAADGALDAMFEVARECYSNPRSALYGFRIVAFVHDEIVIEGPEKRAHEAAMCLQEIMERCMNIYTPDCPTPAEPLVTRIWSKKAKQVWKNGELIPWEM